MSRARLSEHTVIVDDNSLRRAAIARLLELWAEYHDLGLMSICARAIPETLHEAAVVRLILVNFGGVRINDLRNQRPLRMIATAAPRVPIVVLSDHEDGEEAVAAFYSGARGFVPTSFDPSIALQALSLIISGGSFFPTSAMRFLIGQSRPLPHGMGTIDSLEESMPLSGDSPVPAWFDAQECVADTADQDIVASAKIMAMALSEALTERQAHVLELLRDGLSNKLIARKLAMTEATVKVHVRHVMRKLGAANRTEAAVIATKLSHGERPWHKGMPEAK